MWQILTWPIKSLKDFHLNWLLLSKIYIVWTKKVERSYLSWQEWCKIWRKTDLLLRKLHEKFDKFSPEHSKFSKLELWWDTFAQTRKCMTLKFIEELRVMTMKNDTKIEEELTCHFKIDMRNFANFDPNTRKSKTFVLIGSLWPKYILFELQKYRGVIFYDTEEMCKFWRKTDLWFEKRLEKFDKFSPEHLKVSKLRHW